MQILSYTNIYMQAHLQNDGLEWAQASNNFEEHGPKKVSVRKHPLCSLDEDIIPVKPIEADNFLLIREGGVETTKIPHGHMKALDAFGRR